ncbi:MAG TPA: ATP synthase F0 subunit C [Candidatus Angelobacter sp.]|nr:ATP synthase F0 subunit C [Candidatus Angelobacter sp.]
MRKTMLVIFAVMAVLIMVTPMYAQTDAAAAATASGRGWAVPIGAGLGMALAAGLCGLGQGKATASAVESLARNPGARPGLFIFLILGLALIESLALYALVIAFQVLGLK